MTPEFRDKLFAVIRSGMDLKVCNVELSEEECNELMQIGRRQSIQPIIYRGIKRMDLSADCLSQFDRARLRDVQKFIRRDNALQKITTVLGEEAIPYILLKGSVLRDLYPEPDMRTSTDIDILVRVDDLDKAVHALEDHTDLKFKKRNYHDVRLLAPGVILELHFMVNENSPNLDQLLCRAWDYARPTKDSSRYVFTPEFQLFHVIAHASHHLVHSGMGIRPLLDLWLLRHNTTFDEEAVRQMCAECGILIFYEKSGQLVDAWMEGSLAPEGLEQFEKFCLDGGVFGTADSAIVSRARKQKKGAYIWNRVFMNRKDLEQEFPELKEKPYLLPVCQMNRWLRLLDPQKRSNALEELERFRHIKPETNESFDEMMKELGL